MCFMGSCGRSISLILANLRGGKGWHSNRGRPTSRLARAMRPWFIPRVSKELRDFTYVDTSLSDIRLTYRPNPVSGSRSPQ